MRILLISLPLFVGILAACSDKQYEKCPPDHIFNDWGVSDNTHTFGEFDSLYYIFNPYGNLEDSLYYNGDYTDSYYSSDSTRFMLRYTTEDSIMFYIDRRYSVEVNPKRLLMTIKAVGDTTEDVSILTLERDPDNHMIFSCGPDSMFKLLLSKEMKIKGIATNAGSSSNPAGSQNYEFELDTKGFLKAFELADSLNRMKTSGKISKDSIDNKKVHKNRKFI